MKAFSETHNQQTRPSLEGNGSEGPASRSSLDQTLRSLGVEFNDSGLLQLALVHSSYLNEQESVDGEWFSESNERLEFLGDAVLGFIVAGYLYDKHQHSSEGELTVNRISLVRTETLAGWAREFNLDDLLYIARGEQLTSGEIGDRILAGTFEAVLGAIYLDQGIDQARDFMTRLLDRDAEHILNQQQATNYKGRLQELIQEYDQTTPAYETIQMKGPAHDRYFVVRVTHRDKVIGEGGGTTKRAAQQAAAKNALEFLETEGTLATDGRHL